MAIVTDILELLATNANPNTEAIVIIGNFSWLSVAMYVLAPSLKLMPISGIEITAANNIASPELER